MGLTIYKSGQGYWTRVLTAVGLGTIALGGVGWFSQRIIPTLSFINHKQDLYWQGGFAAAVILIAGALLWYFLNKPRIADFMIATENEMKKVNWPSKQAVIGLTWVVVAGTLLMAALLFVSDVTFTKIFQEINILQK